MTYFMCMSITRIDEYTVQKHTHICVCAYTHSIQVLECVRKFQILFYLFIQKCTPSYLDLQLDLEIVIFK